MSIQNVKAQTFRSGIQGLKIIIAAICIWALWCLSATAQSRDNGFGKPPVPPVDGANRLVPAGKRPAPPVVSPVTYDQYSLIINGNRTILTSGEFHYWRLPAPDMWKRIFERMRAAGLNSVGIYLNWSYHSSAPGVYDFSGIRDLDRVLREANEAGLYVIVRAGPCVYGETNTMGWPGWLLSTTATLRSLDPAFITAVQQWYGAALPIVARHQLHKGGSVILVQLDNELVSGDPAYLTALYRMARQNGIEVPLIHNPSGPVVASYGDAVDFQVIDTYPGGLDCTRPWSMKDFSGSEQLEKNYRATLSNVPHPIIIAELQGGGMDNYGGPGYQACHENFGPPFVDAMVRTYLSQGVTGLNWYMFYGGTSWGYLPDNLTYTSYDYGAPVHEYLGLGSKYMAVKRNMQFMRAVEANLVVTQADTGIVSSSNPDLLLNSRINPGSGASFVFLRNRDETKVQETVLQLLTGAGGAKRVPEHGSISLEPHESRVLIANYPADLGRVVYTTSQLLTFAGQGGQETWVFYGKRGASGETKIEMKGSARAECSPGVSVAGSGKSNLISFQYGEEPAYARFNFSKGSLLMVFVDEATACRIWRFPFAGGDALALADAFIGMPDKDGNIRIEAHGPKSVTLFGGNLSSGLLLDGHKVKVDQISVARALRFEADGSSALTAAPVFPELHNWIFRPEPFEGAVGWDDSGWAAVDRYRSLSPDQHDFHYGFVWDRGYFTASGKEKIIRVTSRECYGLWVNGEFLGASSWVTADWSTRKSDPETRLFRIPEGLIKRDKENVIAMLTEDPGSYRRAPKIEFLPSEQESPLEVDIAWKLTGAGAEMRQTLLSPMNAGGLYGERNGWYKPGLNDTVAEWQRITTPHEFHATDAWIGWYRTTFDLNIPANLDAPMAVVLDKTLNAPDKAILFVNGYLMGRYFPERGPQTRFFIPAGILNTNGKNSIAIAVWRRSADTGGLGVVKLEPYETKSISLLQIK